MLAGLSGFAALCLLGWHYLPSGAAPGPAAAIRRVIAAQIEAFGRNDADAAFRLAAPNIQKRFGKATVFMAMVRDAYPEIFRPRSFRFGTSSPRHAIIVQKVELEAGDGNPALALYMMEHEPAGDWRIAGCTLVRGNSPRI